MNLSKEGGRVFIYIIISFSEAFVPNNDPVENADLHLSSTLPETGRVKRAQSFVLGTSSLPLLFRLGSRRLLPGIMNRSCSKLLQLQLD